MIDEELTDRRLLTIEEREEADLLGTDDLKLIDSTLIALASHRWRKVAMIVAGVMVDLGENFPSLPDVFFAERVYAMVENGRFESRGVLGAMRYCEVRLTADERKIEG